MFEQSLLLDSGHGAKARAVAVSLTTQTVVAGVLLLIPLIYTERLAIAQLTLPTFLPLPPPPPHREVQERTVMRHSHVSHPWIIAYDLRRVPPLNTRPEVPNDAPLLPEEDVLNSTPEFIGAVSLPQFSVVPPPAPKPVPPAIPDKPVLVSGTLQAAKLIHKVVPAYPPVAKLAHVSGTVHLLGIVSKDGRIEQLQVTSGHPLLVAAALDAVRQWVYSPTLLGGKPVEVSAPIEVIFTLSQ